MAKIITCASVCLDVCVCECANVCIMMCINVNEVQRFFYWHSLI